VCKCTPVCFHVLTFSEVNLFLTEFGTFQNWHVDRLLCFQAGEEQQD
jgi:hypothetical protein